ncbi:aminoglycoside phosphotransferase family protein [Neobacillus sp. CF12]|uniref:aminoglycoside phosphotransferase family protein n=1 Tax=Neobacillus sp. CF12 TaxID=3055864 RepID=UPI0025A2F0DD|nr:aminoglycoside phosphotransferase family protein [Neobacillus sp. CF12]MDM5330148.1 aminoglycoside phosphotransferase family protein [Neobacillus sp. CF12]
MQISSKFQKKIINAFGSDGVSWLDSLESTIQTYFEKWELTSEGPVENLSYNYVIKVTDSAGAPFILKLGVPNFDTRNEMKTLQIYNGDGCAKLLKYDLEDGVMLLERLVPGRMLSTVSDEIVVIENYTKVWKAIRRPLLDGVSTPSLTHWFEGLTNYRNSGDSQIALKHVQAAEEFFQQVMDSSEGTELLHGDLHHENILYSEENGWMAIDPKGVAGDPYFDVVSFLVNQLDSKVDPKSILKLRVDTICEQLGLDRQRLLKASIALGTLYACWGIEDQDPDWDKTYQCVKWFIEFLE